MKLYSFTNPNYMSQLQVGLQTAHALGEMLAKYKHDTAQLNQIIGWAEHHKVIAILNGGNCKMLNNLFDFFLDEKNKFPFAKFHEDEDSLNSAITAVTILLPEEVYESAKLIRLKKIKLIDWKYVLSPENIYETTEEEDKANSYLSFMNNNTNPWLIELINKTNACPTA